MTSNRKSVNSYLSGLYVWVLTTFFGMVLLDIVYTRLVPEATSALSAVSDFLLLIGFLAFLLAIVAILISWRFHSARNLFITSLFVLLLEFLIPLFFSRITQNTQALKIGPLLRIIPSGLASILSFVGLNKYYQHQTQ